MQQEASEPLPVLRRAARSPSVAEYVNGVLAGDRSMLARAVTLIESNLPAHQAKARELLSAVRPQGVASLRVGITGFPGAGKSTLIEALGCRLIDQGRRLAVLTIDPSSSLSHGSILGDKTRMAELARRPECFIRPSPSGGALGGVTRKSRETILLCEAAGYDTILVETVGVGQNEVAVRQIVDFYLLVMIAGAGDELQGIKKGVIEMADALLINKADGENLLRARRTQQEWALTMKYLSAYTPGWQVPVLLTSALEQTGIGELWQTIETFAAGQQAGLATRRLQQELAWFESLFQEAAMARVLELPALSQRYQQLRQAVANGQVWPLHAVTELLETPWFGV